MHLLRYVIHVFKIYDASIKIENEGIIMGHEQATSFSALWD